VVNVFNEFRRQFDGRVLHFIDESVESTTDSIDLSLDAVEMHKPVGNLTYDVVQARAQATAGNDGGVNGLGVEVQVLASLHVQYEVGTMVQRN